MPLGESFISTLKSNRSIMLDKSRRFRKIPGSYDQSKKEFLNLPKAKPEGLLEIKIRIQKENRVVFIKQLLFVALSMVAVISLIIYLIF
ncbi:hypothetical protein VOI54_08840 [Tamlana sp. 2201CG12-4]|uniref:hypothetical protein n=1 Tax=Tamlana sp. 2201CG12-4 TaxID=3112582 RepID=UPI002DB695B9|nr:hypothetical protein [Tamlana sp. 2201CG12-4]MEC3907125.1 hypothetical protein [Tamlana sp. 2201CG12-4]